MIMYKKKYMCKWIFETYYNNHFSGNLTSRIKMSNNKACYNHIMNYCFDGVNIFDDIFEQPS